MKSRVDRRREGAALVTMMIILLLVAMAGAVLVAFATQQKISVQRSRDMIKAQAYAEAGLHRAYHILKTNFDNASNASLFPPADFDDGRYTLTVTVVNDVQASIESVGECGSARMTVKADVINLPQVDPGTGLPPPTSPWAYAVLVNGYIQHNGAGTVIGAVHVNNYLDCNGSLVWGTTNELCNVSAVSPSKGFQVSGNATVYGTVKAPRIRVTGQENIQNKVVGPVDPIPFPTLDLTPYYQIAVANGQVFNSLNLNGTVNWGRIPGGVRWINGNLIQNGSLNFEGCVIATGYIRFNGAVTQRRVGQLPAIVSRDSYIRVNGHHEIEGLVYAKSDVTWNGSGYIRGAVLVGGNMTFNGAYGNLYYAYCEPSPNAGSTPPSQRDYVIISAWQK